MEAFNDGIGTQEIYDALAECSSVGTDIAIKSIAVTTMTKRTLTFEECVSFEADLKAKRKDIIGMRVYRSSNNNNVQCICVDSTENLSWQFFSKGHGAGASICEKYGLNVKHCVSDKTFFIHHKPQSTMYGSPKKLYMYL